MGLTRENHAGIQTLKCDWMVETGTHLDMYVYYHMALRGIGKGFLTQRAELEIRAPTN